MQLGTKPVLPLAAASRLIEAATEEADRCCMAEPTRFRAANGLLSMEGLDRLHGIFLRLGTCKLPVMGSERLCQEMLRASGGAATGF